jgi:HPt (histidine-containing phosphotransfer) domain-containing protein
VASPASTPLLDKLAAINGLDSQGALAQFGGDIDCYTEILETYMASTAPLLDTLEDGNTGLDLYRITVHGVKSSSKGIGAAAIGGEAATLEEAARNGDVDFIRQKNATFVSEVRALLSGLEAVLGQASGAKQAALESRDALDAKVLAALKEAAEAFSIDGVEEALVALKAYGYSNPADVELLAQLSVAANNCDFDGITELL